MTTIFDVPTTELRVRHDGIRSIATVRHHDRVCDLDDVIEAASQEDAGLAAEYQAILRTIAPELYLSIRKEIDGSPDNGACWYAVEFLHGINGDIITRRPHRVTHQDFRGWNPSDAQVKSAHDAILRALVALGLGQVEYHHVGKGWRVVADHVR